MFAAQGLLEKAAESPGSLTGCFEPNTLLLSGSGLWQDFAEQLARLRGDALRLRHFVVPKVQRPGSLASFMQGPTLVGLESWHVGHQNVIGHLQSMPRMLCRD